LNAIEDLSPSKLFNDFDINKDFDQKIKISSVEETEKPF